MAASVKHVVVDSGPFIKNAPLRNVGENLYTVREVVSEIRDKTTRQRLQVLPYTLNFREPSTESIKAVTDFSKITGDYASLSAIDLRVLALCYQLEKEHVGTDHIKTKPERQITFQSTTRSLENPTEIAGFYVGKPKHKQSLAENKDETDESLNKPEELEQRLNEVNLTENSPEDKQEEQVVPSQSEESGENKCETEVVTKVDVIESTETDPDKGKSVHFIDDGEILSSDKLEEESDEEEEDEDEDDEDDDDDDDDDDGWITPSNIKQKRLDMGDKNVEKAVATVGCMTTDFAMQNVLIQMGLTVISINGMMIKRAKSFVLRCHACYKVTTNMMREFCHNCGNKTLQKVSMTIDDDGSIRYFLSTRKPTSTRGLKYSLPTPKGGKHSNNPVLCEDQREAHQRMTKSSKVKYDVLDEDYEAQNSPFAPIDVTSRAAQLGIRNFKHNYKNQRNPNENKKVYGRRK